MVNVKCGEEIEETLVAEEDSDDDVDPITEFRSVPSGKSVLAEMSTALSECPTLHLDPEDGDPDGYGVKEHDVKAHGQEHRTAPHFISRMKN